MASEKVKQVAAAIREEIQVLLADYAGDFCNEDIERTPEEAISAAAKLHTIEWLQKTWGVDAVASEERLYGVAKAAITAMREPTEEMLREGAVYDVDGRDYTRMIDAAFTEETKAVP